jgi:hypothetical protein
MEQILSYKLSMQGLCMLIAIIFSTSIAYAQNADDDALARCPNYEKNHPVVSELSWSIDCLLQAIYDGDKRIIAELSESARCGGTLCEAEGILYEDASNFILGAKGTGKWRPTLSSEIDSVRTVLKRSTSVLITYAPDILGRVYVKLIPRPGKDSVARGPGLDKDYFVCFFKYDGERSIWVVSGGFCLLETDSYVSEENYNDVVDLTGNAESSPVMIWKPRH